MRELRMLIAIDRRAIDMMLRQQLLEKKTRPGIGIAVDEPDFRVKQTFEFRYAMWIATLDHQSHLARHKRNDTMDVRIEPALACGYRTLAKIALRQVHSGKVASVMRQRNQRVLIADITKVDADIRL